MIYSPVLVFPSGPKWVTRTPQVHRASDVSLSFYQCLRWMRLVGTLMCTFLAVVFPLTSNAAGVRAWVPSGIRLFVAPWTVACQAPLSMGFSKQEYWSGVPSPSRPRDWTGVSCMGRWILYCRTIREAPRVTNQLELVPVPLLNFHCESSASGNVTEFFQLPLLCTACATFQVGKWPIFPDVSVSRHQWKWWLNNL